MDTTKTSKNICTKSLIILTSLTTRNHFELHFWFKTNELIEDVNEFWATAEIPTNQKGCEVNNQDGQSKQSQEDVVTFCEQTVAHSEKRHEIYQLINLVWKNFEFTSWHCNNVFVVMYFVWSMSWETLNDAQMSFQVKNVTWKDHFGKDWIQLVFKNSVLQCLILLNSK